MSTVLRDEKIKKIPKVLKIKNTPKVVLNGFLWTYPSTPLDTKCVGLNSFFMS